MAKNQIKLPPRKWYSLQQAADKLTRELNEPITIDDLLHYYQIDLLPFSIYIKHSPTETHISDIVFSDLLQNENSLPMRTLNFNMISKPQEITIGGILYQEKKKK